MAVERGEQLRLVKVCEPCSVVVQHTSYYASAHTLRRQQWAKEQKYQQNTNK